MEKSKGKDIRKLLLALTFTIRSHWHKGNKCALIFVLIYSSMFLFLILALRYSVRVGFLISLSSSAITVIARSFCFPQHLNCSTPDLMYQIFMKHSSITKDPLLWHRFPSRNEVGGGRLGRMLEDVCAATSRRETFYAHQRKSLKIFWDEFVRRSNLTHTSRLRLTDERVPSQVWIWLIADRLQLDDSVQSGCGQVWEPQPRSARLWVVAGHLFRRSQCIKSDKKRLKQFCHFICATRLWPFNASHGKNQSIRNRCIYVFWHLSLRLFEERL